MATLSSEPKLQLVERREFARLFSELELGAAGAVKMADAARLGKLVKADWLMLGAPYRDRTLTNAIIRLVEASAQLAELVRASLNGGLRTNGRDGLWVGVEDFGAQRLRLKEGSWQCWSHCQVFGRDPIVFVPEQAGCQE